MMVFMLIYFLKIFLVEVILIFFVIASFSPLFMILVFIGYLLCFGVSLVFLLNSYYYSYIIYLLFLSGLLVMFMYVCSIISNEKIYLSFNFFFFLLSMALFFFSFGGSGSFLLVGVGSSVIYYEFYNLLKFFSYSLNIFSVFFVFYLFLCLIVVYEVIKKNKGPLRMGG